MTDEPLTLPFCVGIDTREQLPYTFVGFRADARQGRRPLLVPTNRITIPSGDYSIVGREHEIAVERKSLEDLYSTLSAGRDRFERELGRLDRLRFAVVVVEANWATILNGPPAFSRLNPKSLFRSILAWQQRFVRVHWWACESRRFAETVCLRMLERWHRDHCTTAVK